MSDIGRNKARLSDIWLNKCESRLSDIWLNKRMLECQIFCLISVSIKVATLYKKTLISMSRLESLLYLLFFIIVLNLFILLLAEF